MNNFGTYMTPEKMKQQGDSRTIEELRKLARTSGKCHCGENIWRAGGCGLCFSCTTGDSDASGDSEFTTALGDKKHV